MILLCKPGRAVCRVVAPGRTVTTAAASPKRPRDVAASARCSDQGVNQPHRRQQTPAFLPGVFVVPPAVRVPPHVSRPSYADDPNGIPRLPRDDEYGEAKGPVAIDKMRVAGQLAARALEVACKTAQEGVTTDEVDRAVAGFIIKHGGYPVGINYHGFPRAICASPNEVALHGVPNTRPLESGDIVNFDVVAYLDGAYGDCSAMVCIGQVDEDARRLVETTRECLVGVIDKVGPGVKLNSIGEFCADFASSRGYAVVAEFCGHFIGSELHMKPNVLHVPNGNALELRPGNTFTIEPILVEGGCAKLDEPEADGWTILSKNRGWSAQWEHTVLVTEHGAEVLTMPG